MIGDVIVDFHTHVFPPEVIDQRERYVRDDPTFRLLYGNPTAKLATADDLLRSMDAAAIDASIALGFQWADEATCRRHNDYLLEAAAASSGRIVAFCTLPLATGAAAIEAEVGRCMALGARGFGELRPENAGFDLDSEAGRRLAVVAAELGCRLLFHVSEPVGHSYPGKEGLSMDALYRFLAANPDAAVIGAHWGGGLPFYAAMPEVQQALTGHRYVDTSASSLLYDDGIYERIAGLIGPERILFGSDYPLLGQKRSRRRIEDSGLDESAKALILGGNAARLLGIE
jgi:predicted TIM-barrel fold metal-dependent hydrolase